MGIVLHIDLLVLKYDNIVSYKHKIIHIEIIQENDNEQILSMLIELSTFDYRKLEGYSDL